jgi:hypothetical protein
MNKPALPAKMPPRPEATRMWRKVFSFAAFLGALLVAATFLAIRGNLDAARSAPGASSSQFFLEGDLWWHLTAGKQILATHTWPTSDTYSFTAAGTPWIAYEWLGDIVLALVDRVGGLRGLAALFIALQSAVVLLIYYYAYLRCRNVRVAFLAAAVLMPLASQFAILRPQQFGYGFLLITLICLERFRQGHLRALWLLPIVFAAWVNTHGSFVLGCVALAVYAVCGLPEGRHGGVEAWRWSRDQRRQLEVVSLLSLLALTLTPYGARLAFYPFQLALSQPLNVAVIREWQPLEWGQWFGIMFLLLLLFFLASQVLFRPAYRLEDIVLLLLAVYATAAHARFLMFFVPVFAPMLAGLLARWTPPLAESGDRYFLNAALILMIGAGVVAFLPRSRELEDAMRRRLPLRAVEYLNGHQVPEPMFNDSDWGGYLIASRGPAHKVFIDGRFDVYEYSGVLPDYLRIMQASPQAMRLLAKYNIQSCLLERGSALAGLLATQPAWQKVYTDEISALYVRAPVDLLQRRALARHSRFYLAERLTQDPALRLIGSQKIWDRGAGRTDVYSEPRVGARADSLEEPVYAEPGGARGNETSNES